MSKARNLFNLLQQLDIDHRLKQILVKMADDHDDLAKSMIEQNQVIDKLIDIVGQFSAIAANMKTEMMNQRKTTGSEMNDPDLPDAR